MKSRRGSVSDRLGLRPCGTPKPRGRSLPVPWVWAGAGVTGAEKWLKPQPGGRGGGLRREGPGQPWCLSAGGRQGAGQSSRDSRDRQVAPRGSTSSQFRVFKGGETATTAHVLCFLDMLIRVLRPPPGSDFQVMF